MNKKSILLSKSDFNFLKTHLAKSALSDYNKERLMAEIKEAQIFKDEELPKDVVCLNTETKIKNTENGQEFIFKIVEPNHADIKKQLVSVFAPISIALFGYQTGDIINWEMPDGIKEFKILEVKKITAE